VAALLQAADALRLSSDIQYAFSQAEKSNGLIEWMDLVEPLVEKPILAIFGDIHGHHLARLRYEANSNPELKQYAHWLAYNRATAVPFQIGYKVDVKAIALYDSFFQPTSLNLGTGKPTLIVGSSRT